MSACLRLDASMKACSTSSKFKFSALDNTGRPLKSGWNLNQLVRHLRASSWSSSFVLEIPKDKRLSKSYGSASCAALRAIIANSS